MNSVLSTPTTVDWPAWPTYGLEDDLLPRLEAWQRSGVTTAALATLVQIVGSSPRPLGSEMAVTADGRIAGYVSGGCVEGAVAAEAGEVISSGRPKLLDYGAGSPVLDVQLTCGGRIAILVRRLDDLGRHVAHRRAERRARRDCWLDIDLEHGSEHAVAAEAPGPRTGVFRQHYPAMARLVLVGGDPITLAVAQLAEQLGLEVGLLRPYGPSAPPPGVRLAFYDTRALATALPAVVCDQATAIYSLTHDIDDDESVLLHGLASPAFRLGVLGSRRKADERRARLIARGVPESEIARIDMPAGIDMAATNPREIALSIVARVVAARPRACPIAAFA
ncbi:XdhC family protein [Salinisphaera sp. Q1T1-3]|uniref:XdhC family protein n=1 Tax=Salinisphaera sp. Q1T1-3 TaxID=2321229 RepID=UPI000E73CA07|nr:XdhC family protein [Salinisphaera sp. Q1T1-3]RJS95405.1 XdhC family protein [Salinisphaera sp. Q1T1-3]